MTCPNEATPDAVGRGEGRAKHLLQKNDSTRDLIKQIGNIADLIISAAAQRPGPETNAILARVNTDAWFWTEPEQLACSTVELVGRNPGTEAALPEILQKYGHDGDPLRLEEYVSDFNRLSAEHRRESDLFESSPEDFAALRCTDVANGARFEEQFTGVALHSASLGPMVYDSTRWAPDPKAMRELAKKIPDCIRAEIKAIVLKMDTTDGDSLKRLEEHSKALRKWAKTSASSKGIDNTTREASSTPGINADHIEFDSNPALLNCPNARIDLRTGQTGPHRPYDYATQVCPTEYDPDATCPRWDQFLKEIFQGDTELIEYVRRALGYSLSGDTSWQCWFLLHGCGENGKSRFVAVLRNILGADYCSEIDPEELCAQPWARHSTERAALRGVRYLTSEETKSEREINETFIKSLTGEGRLRARFMRQDSFEFSPVLKLWLSTNNRPVVKDNSHGFWRRVRLIPFEANFSNSPNRDPFLDQKLKAEAPGILAQLVKYAGIAFREGEGVPPARMVEAQSEYRADNDEIGEWLKEHTTDAFKSNTVGKRFLYDNYALSAPGEKEAFNAFNRKLKARGIADKREKMGYVWVGLTLKSA